MTGRRSLGVAAAVHTFRYRQSSLIGAESPLHGCTHAGAKTFALRVPLHATRDCGAFHLKVPSGGAANGTPIEPVFVCENPGAMVRFISRGDAVGIISLISIAAEVAPGASFSRSGDRGDFPADTMHRYANAGGVPCVYYVAALIMRPRGNRPRPHAG